LFQIEAYERPSDKVTKKLRGFCFITFKKDGILRKCCAEKNQILDGASVSKHFINVTEIKKKSSFAVMKYVIPI